MGRAVSWMPGAVDEVEKAKKNSVHFAAMLPLLRHALLSVVRNKLRTLHALVGIALALSMVTGSFIAVDSSSIGMLRATVDRVPVDFVCQNSTWAGVSALDDVDKIQDAIKTVRYVTESTPIIAQYGLSIQNPAGNLTYLSPTGSHVIMVPSDPGGFFEHFKISGGVPAPGTVAISRYMADYLKLDVGGVLQYQAVKNTLNESAISTYYCNLTFVISEIWTQDMPSVQSEFPDIQGDPSDSIVIYDALNPVIMNMNDSQGLITNLSSFGASEYWLPSELFFFVWIDRGEVISAADIPGTVERLDFIHNRLLLAGQPFELVVPDSRLIVSLRGLDPQLSLLKGLALILSLPVIALGVYLSLVGVDLGITGRRREIGILKSRGASNRQVFSYLMLESVIVGVAAAAIGLLLGAIVSRFLMNATSSFGTTYTLGGGVDSSWTDFRISPWTVVLCVLFGIALMLLSTYRPFKRVSRISVTKALHHYAPSMAQTSYSAWPDIMLIAWSAVSVVSIALGMNAAHGRGFSWVEESVLTIILTTGVFMFPIMPFFLSMGIVSLMTMGSRRLYARLTVLVKPWTKELTYFVDRNISRNPRRASNLGIIISLALAFGIFISVTMESTFAQEKEEVKFSVGSDIKMAGKLGRPSIGVTYQGLRAVDALPGVERASHYIALSSTSFLGEKEIVALNSSDYLQVVHPSDFYFIGHGSGVLEDLEENGTCLMTKELAERHDVLEGDVISVDSIWSYNNASFGVYRNPLHLRVIGLVKGLPGLTSYSVFIDSITIRTGSISRMVDLGATVGVLLRTTQGADPNEVAVRAVAAFGQANINATAVVFKDQLNAMRADQTYRGISAFLYTQYSLALLIMSVGVGLIIFIAVSDREHELACIMARGSSKSQMRRMLMGESISLMSLGLIVGTSVGVLTAYLFNTLWGATQYNRTMVFTWVSWLVLAVSVASLLIASLLATSRAGKVGLAEVLRVRGG